MVDATVLIVGCGPIGLIVAHEIAAPRHKLDNQQGSFARRTETVALCCVATPRMFIRLRGGQGMNACMQDAFNLGRTR